MTIREDESEEGNHYRELTIHERLSNRDRTISQLEMKNKEMTGRINFYKFGIALTFLTTIACSLITGLQQRTIESYEQIVRDKIQTLESMSKLNNSMEQAYFALEDAYNASQKYISILKDGNDTAKGIK